MKLQGSCFEGGANPGRRQALAIEDFYQMRRKWFAALFLAESPSSSSLLDRVSEGHPLEPLEMLPVRYGGPSDRLVGDLGFVLDGLTASLADGRLTPENAAAALDVFGAELDFARKDVLTVLDRRIAAGGPAAEDLAAMAEAYDRLE